MSTGVENGRMVDSDAVSPADLEEWSAEFDRVVERIEPLFVHSTSRKHAEQYF